MKKLFEKLFSSFDNSTIGFSARKLSSFAAVTTCIYLSITLTTTAILDVILLTWLAFGLLCLGIITMQQIVQFKTGTVLNETTEKTVETKTETTTKS